MFPMSFTRKSRLAQKAMKDKRLDYGERRNVSYLKTLGYNDAKINQMANYAFIDWKDNMEILDEAPSIYYPVVCEGRSPEEIQRM